MDQSYINEILKSNNSMASTVVVDLDGVVVDFRKCTCNCDYSNYPNSTDKLKRLECPLNEDALVVLNYIRSLGLKITIHTGRVDTERTVTEQWLKSNKVPYDLLVLNKPRGFIYIDDLAHEFINWVNVQREILHRLRIRNVSRNVQ